LAVVAHWRLALLPLPLLLEMAVAVVAVAPSRWVRRRGRGRTRRIEGQPYHSQALPEQQTMRVGQGKHAALSQ
jgi:hypothetical protein